MGPMERNEEERRALVEFVEDADRVDVDLAKVVYSASSTFLKTSSGVDNTATQELSLRPPWLFHHQIFRYLGNKE